jgi:hypothetical protein
VFVAVGSDAQGQRRISRMRGLFSCQGLLQLLQLILLVCWNLATAKDTISDSSSCKNGEDPGLCKQICIEDGFSGGGYCGKYRKMDVCYCRGKFIHFFSTVTTCDTSTKMVKVTSENFRKTDFPPQS